MTVNTQQLLASVVSRPKLSAVDAKFMAAIWESFTTWMTEQLHAKTAVRCLELGDFTLRRDKIGPMEFFNPMFVMNEGYAHRHGLHDRRPKPAALDSRTGRPLDVDIGKVTQMATDKLGEVVLRETVEAALKDAIERLGEFCSDDRAYGIVTVDLLFGKLVCENRSVEFHFLSTDERARALDARKKRAGAAAAAVGGGQGAQRSVNFGNTAADADADLGIVGASATGGAGGARPSTAASRLSGAGTRPQTSGGRASGKPAPTAGSVADPPLQRPRRPTIKKPPKLDPRDVLLSHAAQLARKASAARAEHESEADQFASDMARLRGEMVLELEERVQRRSNLRDVALIHQVQAHEKALRDRDARQVGSTADFFPFRTEEEVAAHTRASNAILRANLDQQLREREDARRSLGAAPSGAYSTSSRGGSEYGGSLSGVRGRHARGSAPGTPEPTSLPMDLPEPAAASAGVSADRPHLAMQAAIDDAYSRYTSFLASRAGADEAARAYAHEQAALAEHAELLRREEGKRRTAEMSEYLKRQMEWSQNTKKAMELEKKLHKVPPVVLGLPRPKPRNLEQEEATRQQLRSTLDQQVAAKRRAQEAQASEDLIAQTGIIQLVSSELRESRERDLQRKAEEKAVLRSAWDRQCALKELEKAVGASS